MFKKSLGKLFSLSVLFVLTVLTVILFSTEKISAAEVSVTVKAPEPDYSENTLEKQLTRFDFTFENREAELGIRDEKNPVYGHVIAIEVDCPARLYIKALTQYYGLFADKELTQGIERIRTAGIQEARYDVYEAGTYYLALGNYNLNWYNNAAYRKFFDIGMYASGGGEIKIDEEVRATTLKQLDELYYKFSVTESGNYEFPNKGDILDENKEVLFAQKEYGVPSRTQFLGKGTYYYRLKGNDDTRGYRILIRKKPVEELKEGESVYEKSNRDTQILYKYTPEKDGIVYFSSEYNYGAKVHSLSPDLEKVHYRQLVDGCHGWLGIYAVKANKTYYFLLESNTDVWWGDVIYTTLNFESRADNGGTSKKKAKKITGTVSGLAELNSKTGDWYKYSCTKKGKKTLTVTGTCRNVVNITVYNSKGKKVKTVKYQTNDTGISETLSLKKGTYYIKVEGVDGGTGNYTITLK